MSKDCSTGLETYGGISVVFNSIPYNNSYITDIYDQSVFITENEQGQFSYQNILPSETFDNFQNFQEECDLRICTKLQYMKDCLRGDVEDAELSCEINTNDPIKNEEHKKEIRTIKIKTGNIINSTNIKSIADNFETCVDSAAEITLSPTKNPTISPIYEPTLFPTTMPTPGPTLQPTTKNPTYKPTLFPTPMPTPEPTTRPIVANLNPALENSDEKTNNSTHHKLEDNNRTNIYPTAVISGVVALALCATATIVGCVSRNKKQSNYEIPQAQLSEGREGSVCDSDEETQALEAGKPNISLQEITHAKKVDNHNQSTGINIYHGQ